MGVDVDSSIHEPTPQRAALVLMRMTGLGGAAW
jgi:hypothetical protein